MPRLKPTTRDAVEKLADEMRALADDLQASRPFAADIFRSLAKRLPQLLVVPDSPLRIDLPQGSSHYTVADSLWIVSETFDEREYRRRLVKGMS